MTDAPRRRPFYRRKALLLPAGTLLALILIAALAFRLSPWPGALLIRYEFNRGGVKTKEEMEKWEPRSGIAVIRDQQYRRGDGDARLDVYFPDRARQDGERLPVIIWTHGGAWLSGDKTDAAPYFKLLAQRGYTVIAPDYSLAPRHRYPAAVRQLNDMYAYVQQNAEWFHADTQRIVLAGDSAGANLSAQMAALITNPEYASDVGITPTLKPEQLRGVILDCGIYMMERLAHPNRNRPKIVGWGNDVTVWAYSGTRDFSSPVIREMSPYYHVTKDFPATFITGGNDDPLTDVQSRPLADKLDSLGVAVTRLFYEEDHTPRLPHEYQFMLDTPDARNALQATLSFAEMRTR